jgi:hypothetical protein
MCRILCIPGIHSCMHAYRITRVGDASGVRARRRGDSAGGAAVGGARRRRTGVGPSRVP